jgi:hypothetical protein
LKRVGIDARILNTNARHCTITNAQPCRRHRCALRLKQHTNKTVLRIIIRVDCHLNNLIILNQSRRGVGEEVHLAGAFLLVSIIF